MAFGLIFCDISPSCQPTLLPLFCANPGPYRSWRMRAPAPPIKTVPQNLSSCRVSSRAASQSSAPGPRAIVPQTSEQHLLARSIGPVSKYTLFASGLCGLSTSVVFAASPRCAASDGRAASQHANSPCSSAQLRPRVLRPSSCRRRARAGAGSCRFSSAPPPARRAASAAPTAPRAGPWPASRSGSVPPWSW